MTEESSKELSLADRARVAEVRALGDIHVAAAAMNLGQARFLWAQLSREFATRGIDLGALDEAEGAQDALLDLQVELADAEEEADRSGRTGPDQLSPEVRSALTLLVKSRLITADQVLDIVKQKMGKETDGTG